MKFIITSGTSSEPKPGPEVPFSDELFAAYMKYNEDLAKAGVLVASEGLNPAGGRARVGVKNGKRHVIDGPFTEAKELLGGFYLIEVDSVEEAIEWAMRCPVGFSSADELNIHQLTGAQDIPAPFLDVIRKVAPTWSKSLGLTP